MSQKLEGPFGRGEAEGETVPTVQFSSGRAATKGAATRERILDVAQLSVLSKGFGATSIEEVITEAGITKSGFFYHFRDKNELAREMLRRYVTQITASSTTSSIGLKNCRRIRCRHFWSVSNCLRN